MLTVNSQFNRTISLFGKNRAIVNGSSSYNWKEFGQQVAQVAGLLKSLGVERGGRFAVISHNSFQQAKLLQAGYWLGAVPVPVNYRLAAPEIKFILDDSCCQLLIVEDQFFSLLESEELRPWNDKSLYLSAEKASVPWPQYAELILASAAVPCVDVAEDDDALLLYTGGTTGRSKGVRLTHANIATNALQIAQQMQTRSDDLYLHIAPMFHAADLVSNAYSLAGAGHIYLAQPSGRAILEVIHKYRVTATMIPPTLVIMALEDSEYQQFDLTCLRQFVFGSAPMTPKWIQAALDGFSSTDIWHGYGLTETSPMLTLSMLQRQHSGRPERLKSAGQPVVGTDLKIVNDEGKELPCGEIGEVVVRGPQIAKGYLNLPEETAKIFKDGWFYTGDVGKTDDEQYLYLLDRKKDMVITGGENVYTGEVEAVLCLHPQVLEVAVFGAPNELYGEALIAAIVPRSEAILSEEDVIAHCRKYIGGYKIPRQVQFLDALPKSAVGKVVKGDLRSAYISKAEN